MHNSITCNIVVAMHTEGHLGSQESRLDSCLTQHRANRVPDATHSGRNFNSKQPSATPEIVLGMMAGEGPNTIAGVVLMVACCCNLRCYGLHQGSG